MKGFFKNSSLVGQFILFLLVLLFSVLLLGFVFSGLNKDVFSQVSLMRIALCLQFFFLLFFCPLFLAFLWSDRPLEELYLTQKPDSKIFFFLFLLMLLFIPFANFLADINNRIPFPEYFHGLELFLRAWEEKATQQIDLLLSRHSVGAVFLNLFLLALLPAIGEELFFRGTLQRIFKKLGGTVFAIWITAFLFSALHFQFFGFFPRLLFGAFFGYLLVWSESLWLPIFAHFVNNALAVLFYSFSKNGYDFGDIDSIGTKSTLWLGCLSGALLLVGIFFLRQIIVNSTRQNTSS